MGGYFSEIDFFILDMDGTIYLGDQWIDGAMEFLQAVVQSGRQYVFLTNNSSKNADIYAAKLRGMGLDINKEKVITSGQATIAYLKQNHAAAKVFLLGNDLLKAEFSEAGIILEEDYPEVVVTAFDTTLNYAKMCKVCDLVRAGLPYLATHPDLNCPTESGFIPDIGAIQAFIKASASRDPDHIIGKPNRTIMEYLLERTGAIRERSAVVGDRLYTDIAAGVNNGFTGILVLSGEATRADVEKSPVKPHLIYPSVKEMIKELSPS